MSEGKREKEREKSRGKEIDRETERGEGVRERERGGRERVESFPHMRYLYNSLLDKEIGRERERKREREGDITCITAREKERKR